MFLHCSGETIPQTTHGLGRHLFWNPQLGQVRGGQRLKNDKFCLLEENTLLKHVSKNESTMAMWLMHIYICRERERDRQTDTRQTDREREMTGKALHEQ